jgi:hypothetical protein
MIIGRPIDGEPLCMNIDSSGWRQQMEALIGRVPQEHEDKSKDRVPAGATYTWIVQNTTSTFTSRRGHYLHQCGRH